MSKPAGPPPPQAYEWGLFRKSTKRVWPGLTTRELQMIVNLIAFKNPQDWLLWHVSWPEWVEMVEGIALTKYESLVPNLKSIHVAPPKLSAEKAP